MDVGVCLFSIFVLCMHFLCILDIVHCVYRKLKSGRIVLINWTWLLRDDDIIPDSLAMSSTAGFGSFWKYIYKYSIIHIPEHP